MERAISVLGLGVLIGLAWLMSTNRRAVSWRPVLWGVGLQIALALILLLPQVGDTLFKGVDRGVHELLSYSEAGADFVFQTVEPHEIVVYDASGAPHSELFIGRISPPLKSFAFWILPTVIFFSAFMALLYHYGLMQRLVAAFAWVMQRTMKTSGAESLSAAANIFVGQTEAPLVVRPFVDKMTLSELHAVMVGGFATVAGGVMAIYVGVVALPGIAGHLVMASMMSAPAALAISKIMLPETEEPVTRGTTRFDMEKLDANGIEALSRGALDGLTLALNIAAMLLVFVAAIEMVNAVLGLVGSWLDVELTLQGIFGWVFSPLAWTMGVPWEEARTVGMLLGEKIVLTELLAFIHFGELQADAALALSERSAIITSYALCGFANFASIGIQIGGIGGIAPGRRGDLARIGFRAMIGGTLAAMMTGTVAGIIF